MSLVISYPDVTSWVADWTGHPAGRYEYTAYASDQSYVTVTVDVPFAPRRIAANPALGISYAAGPYITVPFPLGQIALGTSHTFAASATVGDRGSPTNLLARIDVALDASFNTSNVIAANAVLGASLGMAANAMLDWSVGQALPHLNGISFVGAAGHVGEMDLSLSAGFGGDAEFERDGAASVSLQTGFGMSADAVLVRGHRGGIETITLQHRQHTVSARHAPITVRSVARDAKAALTERVTTIRIVDPSKEEAP